MTVPYGTLLQKADASNNSSENNFDTRNKITLDIKKNFTAFIAIKPQRGIPDREKNVRHRVAKRATELDFHFDNIKSIIRYSNATPIRSRVGSKYACGYCTNHYSSPSELKEHSLETHRSDKPECLRTLSLSRYVVYLDVTNLQCLLCKTSVPSLKDLMHHLKTDHSKVTHMDIKSHLIPFDFSKGLQCVECCNKFQVFEDLLEHMSSHYRNYTCKRSSGIRTKQKVAYIEISAEPVNKSKTQETSDVHVLLKKKNELDLHLDNLRVILANSNATTIRCRGGIGYVCCFCDAQYPEAADLKRHTLQSHDDPFESNFMKSQAMPTLLIKLDITNLNCKLCNKYISELQDLLDHLKDDHGIGYHKDIKSHIVPFRFEEEVLRCVVCEHVFNNFKVLLEHMNRHFQNYVCEFCQAGFVNRRASQMHGYRHRTGEHHCAYCGKCFDNRVKQRAHVRAVYVCRNKRSRCGYCGERFTDYAKKHEHEERVHGARRTLPSCRACERTFRNQRALSLHLKTYHLMQR
ncbi:oocyte zinc finger protein XlCOF22-like [Battus philenor]|uniref:oocyte zinc finger protein XlCOF22-like n=1 Tax=Battus philenor TaxID=42288 RepID=UPI0035CEA83C